jgi:hypothetical protein
MVQNDMWIKKMLLLCAYAFPPKYPLVFIERVWLYIFFSSCSTFGRARVYYLFYFLFIAIPFPPFSFAFAKDFSLEMKIECRAYLWIMTWIWWMTWMLSSNVGA